MHLVIIAIILGLIHTTVGRRLEKQSTIQLNGCLNNCHGNGECIQGECNCSRGYGGIDCSAVGCLNECSGHGKCKDPRFDKDISLVVPVCVCDDNWLSKDCSINEQAATTSACPADCNKHGECVNGVCECEESYRGNDCSEKFCLNECSFHGKCTEEYECKCDEGWKGDDCSSIPCPNNCGNHGKCMKSGRCSCEPGYDSIDCSTEACPRACSGRGECNVSENGSHQCNCDGGYYGNDCSSCDEKIFCSGHGQCIDPSVTTTTTNATTNDNTRSSMEAVICYCEPGFTAHDCSVSQCSFQDNHDICNGKGKCSRSKSNDDFKCECEHGYSGLMCTVKECDKHCGNEGVCVWKGNEMVCECNNGFTGEECSQSTCSNNDGLICGGNGICKDSLCYCVSGYLPPLCENKECQYDCSGNGACVDGVCECENGFYGPSCKIRMRNVKPSDEDCHDVIIATRCKDNCNEHGNCDIDNGICECHHDSPWYGSTCQLKQCPADCSGQGLCDDNGSCTCKEGLQGDDCSKILRQ